MFGFPVLRSLALPPSLLHGAAYFLFSGSGRCCCLLLLLLVLTAATMLFHPGSRDTKDALVVTNCGAEAIAFLKVSSQVDKRARRVRTWCWRCGTTEAS